MIGGGREHHFMPILGAKYDLGGSRRTTAGSLCFRHIKGIALGSWFTLLCVSVWR